MGRIMEFEAMLPGSVISCHLRLSRAGSRKCLDMRLPREVQGAEGNDVGS